MTTYHNRGSCFWCGAQVDGDYTDEIGHTRIWCCGERECQRELRNDQRAEQAETEARAHEDNYERYR